MDIISLLTAALGTAAGKAVAVSAVAAASVGGLAAADVVELPLLEQDRPTEVTDETPVLPTEAKSGDDVADEEADVEAKKTAAQENRQNDETTTEDEGGEPNENADFGQGVALDAQDGGVDGPTIAGITPAADRPAQPEAAERQDAGVRQDSGADVDGEDDLDGDDSQGADVAEAQQGAVPGSQADGYRP